MADYNDLLKLMKKAAVEAVEASMPVKVCIGKVIATAPLEVSVDQKIHLKKAQLILTETVTKEPLQNDDGVILLRQQGGQKYIIIDRIGVLE